MEAKSDYVLIYVFFIILMVVFLQQVFLIHLILSEIKIIR